MHKTPCTKHHAQNTKQTFRDWLRSHIIEDKEYSFLLRFSKKIVFEEKKLAQYKDQVLLSVNEMMPVWVLIFKSGGQMATL